MICYADDSGLGFRVTNENRADLVSEINVVLGKLSVWAADNKTTFEHEKTEVILFTRKHKKHQLDISGLVFEGFMPTRVHEMKLVGFTFDSALTWRPMVDRLAKKA